MKPSLTIYNVNEEFLTMGKNAFTSGTISWLNKSIETLFFRMMATNPSPPLSHDDLLNLLAPASDRYILKMAPTVTESYYSNGVWEIDWMVCGVSYPLRFKVRNTSGIKPPFEPLKPQLQPDANFEHIEMVTSWVKRRVEIGRDFGRIKAVVGILNETLKTPAHVRFAWPSIIGLLRTNEYTVELANKLGAFRVPRDMPSLPLGVREACRKSAGTVASALLLPEVKEEKSPEAVSLYMQTSAVIVEDGFGFPSM